MTTNNANKIEFIILDEDNQGFNRGKDNEWEQCETCKKIFTNEEDGDYQGNYSDWYCHKCQETLTFSDEEDEKEFCECSFPKFIIKDGIQSCRHCGLVDHYKLGVVENWSEDEEEKDKI